MSQQMLEIRIQCGDSTCAEAPGKFCPQLQVSRFGSDFSCHLFSKQNHKGRWESLEDKDGWLQRHPLCLASERKQDE